VSAGLQSGARRKQILRPLGDSSAACSPGASPLGESSYAGEAEDGGIPYRIGEHFRRGKRRVPLTDRGRRGRDDRGPSHRPWRRDAPHQRFRMLRGRRPATRSRRLACSASRLRERKTKSRFTNDGAIFKLAPAERQLRRDGAGRRRRTISAPGDERAERRRGLEGSRHQPRQRRGASINPGTKTATWPARFAPAEPRRMPGGGALDRTRTKVDLTANDCKRAQSGRPHPGCVHREVGASEKYGLSDAMRTQIGESDRREHNRALGARYRAFENERVDVVAMAPAQNHSWNVKSPAGVVIPCGGYSR